MRDFFDEDFPLSEKQEAELRKKEAEELAEDIPKNVAEDLTEETLLEEPYCEPSEEAAEEAAEPVYEAPDEEISEDFMSEYTEEKYLSEDYFGDGEVENAIDIDESDEVSMALEKALTEVMNDLEAVEAVPEAINEEQVECDPLEAAPLLDLDDNEPLDDNFLPHAPIIIADDSFEPLEGDELDEELKALTEKLDSMERAVSAMAVEDADDGTSEPTYEFDERYFAEEETTAYKHPELVKKTAVKPSAAKKQPMRIKANIDVDLKTVAKVGAAVAGVALAVKLLSGDNNKKR